MIRPFRVPRQPSSATHPNSRRQPDIEPQGQGRRRGGEATGCAASFRAAIAFLQYGQWGLETRRRPPHGGAPPRRPSTGWGGQVGPAVAERGTNEAVCGGPAYRLREVVVVIPGHEPHGLFSLQPKGSRQAFTCRSAVIQLHNEETGYQDLGWEEQRRAGFRQDHLN